MSDASDANVKEIAPLSMEEKIHACRRSLLPDPINHRAFERRYRPTLESVQSSLLEFPDGSSVALRRFQIRAQVWELVEFMFNGFTDTCLLINFQTQKILEYTRYVDAEVTLVDQIQDRMDKLGGKN